MIKILKDFTKRDYLIVFLCIAFIALQVWLDLKIPDYMSTITMLVKTEGSKMSEILNAGSKMLICAGVSLLFAIITGYLTSFLSATFSKKIRKSVFEKVQSFSTSEIKKFSTSSLINRTTNDVNHVQMFIAMGLQLIIKSPIMAVWAILKILNKNITWSLATFIVVLILLILVIILIIIVVPKFKLIQKLVDKINLVAREHLTGVRVIRSFNAENYQVEKFKKANNDLTGINLFAERMMSLLSPFIYLSMNGLNIAIYAIGVSLISNANIMDRITLFSDMVVFSSYAMQVIMSFLMLAFIFVMYPRASVSYNRIREVIDEKESIKGGKFNGNTKEYGTIEFKKVSFKYPDADEYVLKNISFKVNSGETFAIIGSTGSGKTTIVNLLMRFYDATEGEILIDGVNIRDYKLEALYKKIGYVPQKPIILSGTVSSNITYGDNKNSKEGIINACKISDADEFVLKMNKKYNSHISRGGTNVSGGQKQRIAIARAVNRDPEIYLFDDSFSALDYNTDYEVRNNLKNNPKKATNVIVAQRIGTILNADKIMVLEKGKCSSIGTHKELLKKNKVYKEIAYSQITKEELENA